MGGVIDDAADRRLDRFECDTCHRWPQRRNWANHMTAYPGHWPLPDEYKEETDAAMNYGDGYNAAVLERAEADFIAATRRLERLRKARGLPPLSLKDLAARQDGGGEGDQKSETEGDGGNETTHGTPPAAESTDAIKAYDYETEGFGGT